jgi:hypothetical protein
MLGDGYGYCPRCGQTTARRLFAEQMDNMLALWQKTDETVSARTERGETWENMTMKSVSELEALAKHLRRRLLCFPMTANRRKRLENLDFQQPLSADASLVEWFDIGFLKWVGNDTIPQRTVPQSEAPFVQKMLHRRHILIHNRGLVDADYLELSGDVQVALDERIRIRSNEAKHYVETVRAMGANLIDNVEYGFREG